MLKNKGIQRDDKKPIKKPIEKPVERPMPMPPTEPVHPICPKPPVYPRPPMPPMPPMHPECRCPIHDYPMLPNPDSVYPCPQLGPEYRHCPTRPVSPIPMPAPVPGIDLNEIMRNPRLRRCIEGCIRNYGCMRPEPRQRRPIRRCDDMHLDQYDLYEEEN